MQHKMASQTKIGMGLWLVFVFTAGIFIGGISLVPAQGAPGIESSYGSEDESGGIVESVITFFKGIVSWMGEVVESLVAGMNEMFGFERGEGSQAMFGTVFYFFLIVALLFAGKFAFNIVRDTVKSVVPKGGPSRPRRPKEK